MIYSMFHVKHLINKMFTLKQQTADREVNRLPLDVGVKEKDMDI